MERFLVLWSLNTALSIASICIFPFSWSRHPNVCWISSVEAQLFLPVLYCLNCSDFPLPLCLSDTHILISTPQSGLHPLLKASKWLYPHSFLSTDNEDHPLPPPPLPPAPPTTPTLSPLQSKPPPKPASISPSSPPSSTSSPSSS